MNLPRRVLALGAHPDDLELACAGTLARFVEAGSTVRLAVACQGDRGGDGPPESLAATRREECLRSAAILGVSIDFLGFGDSDVPDTFEARDAVVRLIRETRPDLILTHAPDDYHEDHVRVGQLTARATWSAASSGHRDGLAPLDRPPVIAYIENTAGLGPPPTHFVDISATIDLKRRMLACHASQLPRDDGGISDLADLAQTLARLRGFQCGVRFAEGFRTADLWGRRRPEPLFP
jgi:LmbE family N-acetylglucosaminyl deacetylase